VDPLLNEIDVRALAKLIEGSGLDYKLGKKSWIFDCPRCGKKNKLYIRRSDGRFVCWYCAKIDGFEGRPEYALRELLGLPLEDLRFKLYGIGLSAGGSFIEFDLQDFWDDDEEDPTVDDDPLIPVTFPYHFYDLDHPFSKKGREYLEARGLPANLCREYDIRYSPIQRRVIFPVKMGGTLYGWQARTILPGVEPKILTSDDLPRDRALMFYDRLRGSPHAIIVEGPVDGLKCHLVGGNAVTMGKAVSRAQVRLVVESGVTRVYLGLDPDAAEETARLVRDLYGIDVYVLEPARGYEDLGDMPLEGVVEQFHGAQRVTAGHLFLYVK